ncbi:hypothetical protein HJFPF1_05302 [Paramyrothecium foliicola]|nr:hypothetical protein HJFPF1_05302 [Paramyrothecium foliicola]
MATSKSGESRSPSYSTHILDLPYDILQLIVGCFDNADLKTRGQINWAVYENSHHRQNKNLLANVQTIRSIRLVCRQLHNVASQLLCPVLPIDLNQESLDRARRLLQNPFISEGVRGVQLGLDYRPAELAHDIQRFADCRMNDFRRIYFYSSYQYELHDGTDDEIEKAGTWTRHSQCTKEYTRMCSLWEDDISAGASRKPDEDVHPYQRILRQTFAEYRQKHEEQLHLIESGSFVRAIGSLVTRLRNPVCLNFRDELCAFETPSSHSDWPNVILEKALLARSMVKPQTWDTIQSLSKGARLVPARILADLPIAIYKAGGRICGVRIDCFPILKDHDLLWSQKPGDALRQQRADLGIALASLETFKFRCSRLNADVKRRHLTPDIRSDIDGYLNAALGGHHLQEVDVDMRGFGISPIRRCRYPIGPALQAGSRPSISDVSLCDVSITQAELESFALSLGPRMKKLCLLDVELLDGSWQRPLELLRDKVQARCVEERCVVWFNSLSGGEFGKRFRAVDRWEVLFGTDGSDDGGFNGDDINADSSSEEADEDGDRYLEVCVMVRKAQDYVTGSDRSIDRSALSSPPLSPFLMSPRR